MAETPIDQATKTVTEATGMGLQQKRLMKYIVLIVLAFGAMYLLKKYFFKVV